MDGETISIVIAQNGLSTAAMLIANKAVMLAIQAEKEPDTKKASRLRAESKKKARLAAALRSANAGLTDYLSEVAKL